MHFASDVLSVLDPATGKPIAHVFGTAPSQIRAIVARAERAAATWGSLPFARRAQPLVRLRERVAQGARDLAEAIALGTGRSLIEAMLFEVTPVVDTLDECIAHATDDLADEPIAALVTLPALFGRYRAVLLPRTPRAVIGVIAPLDSPFKLALTPAVLALTAGNAVIVKSSPSAALVGVLIERLLDEAFADFPGLAQVVHGPHATGAALTTSEGIDAVVGAGAPAAVRVGTSWMDFRRGAGDEL